MDFLNSSVLLFDDEDDNLHLVIKSGPEKTEVEELHKKISHGDSLVPEEAAENGVTSAPPDYEVTEDEEIYSYRFIEDCCNKTRLLALKPYRLNKQSKYPENFNDEYSRNFEVEDKSKEKQRKASGSQDALHKGSSVAGTSGMKAQKNKGAREISSESDDSLIVENTPPKRTLKVSRRQYTDSEKKCIINYVMENKACGFVKGRAMWQMMEAKQICPGRTWQSMKEHYIKKILPNIETSALSDEDESTLKYQSQNSSDESSLESASVSGSKRRYYTNAEKIKIINYIIKHEAYDHVKGQVFWRTVEMEKICPGRTWQSMRGHYIKQIIQKINTFDLPKKEVARLKRAFS